MIQFGIPKQRTTRPELFPDTPVVTMQEWEGKGYNKRFVFNKKAVEVMNLEPGLSRINFAFDGDIAYIAKQPGEDSVLVGKNLSISNKNFYDYIAKIYNLDSSVDNHLELADKLELGDIKAYLLKVINEGEVEKDSDNPFDTVDSETMPLEEEGMYESVGVENTNEDYV